MIVRSRNGSWKKHRNKRALKMEGDMETTHYYFHQLHSNCGAFKLVEVVMGSLQISSHLECFLVSVLFPAAISASNNPFRIQFLFSSVQK